MVVSWSLFLMPADRMSHSHMAEIASSLVDAHSGPAPLPTVRQVLTALVAAGCHGAAWYRLDGLEDPLPRCTDYQRCAAGQGNDLGEVSLHCGRDLASPVGPEDLVECVSLRKPRAGSLAAAVALTSISTAQIVFDEGLEHFLVVQPDDAIEDLRNIWPW